MKDVTFSNRANTIELRQDSDGMAVVVLKRDLEELLNQINKVIEQEKRIEELRTSVKDTVVEYSTHFVSFKQTYDDNCILIDKDQIPKLIEVLQEIEKAG